MDTQTTSFNTKIFIGGISVKMNEGTIFTINSSAINQFLDELKTYFAQFGKIKNFVLVKSKKTNQPLGFGFVEYQIEEDARKVLSVRHEINGRDVR